MPNGLHATEGRIGSGISGLDEVLNGGLIPHRVYLLDGKPGSGKTTAAMQFMLEGVRLGEPCLYITLSEAREELIASVYSHGWSDEGIDIREFVADEGQLEGDSQVTMYHPSEVELWETTRCIIEAVKATAPRRMVLDSLSEMRLLAQTPLRYRQQILALKQFFVDRRCTVLLLDDRTAEGPDLQLHSLVHGVISLEYRLPAFGALMRQLYVAKFRGIAFHTGLHDCSIERGGMQVFPRLRAADPGSDFDREPLSSGVMALDTLMGGGVDRGTSTLLIGPPGSGKSTVALQYAAAAAQRGQHAVIFAFEESQGVLLSRARGVGIEMRPGDGAGDIALQHIDSASISPGEFAHRVKQAVERDDARVVVIDSLNGYLNAMPADQFLVAQLHGLLSYLNNRGVATFVIVAQTGIVDSKTREPVDASYLSDAVVLFRAYEHAGKVKKAISVVKKRTGGHEQSIRQLWFDGQGVHVGAPLVHLRGVLGGVPVELGGPLNGAGRGEEVLRDDSLDDGRAG